VLVKLVLGNCLTVSSTISNVDREWADLGAASARNKVSPGDCNEYS